ncbi:MAG: glycyl-radical enzyme activating protein [Bacteroidetes bacterium]|nr:MAG: glycyl-radical enzyme activating protein [Bacteroidota bacterium]
MGSVELTGTLFDIQGFSVHDGPGCRTLIFLKGCPLSCRWCSNPEGRNPFPEPLYRQIKCTLDGLCVEACPHQAASIVTGKLILDRTRCRSCTTFECTAACCTEALQRGGYSMTVDELYYLIQRDRQYWGSRGGITLTGGEPFFQPEFTAAVLKRCHTAYIHTAVETCGEVPASAIEPSLPYLDWLFFDLKQMDPGLHREGTGHSNRQILENAQWLSGAYSGRMVYRMTIVPGYNDKPEHISRLAGFISSTGGNEINLLPLHHLGREKYPLTGRCYYTDELHVPSQEALLGIREILVSEGIVCYIGSETPF